MKANNKIYVAMYAIYLTPADFNIDLLMLELADRCLAIRPTPKQIYITAQSDILASTDIHNIVFRCLKNNNDKTEYQLLNIGMFGPFKK